MNLKHRLMAAGIWITPNSRELFLMVSDFRAWAETERDLGKAAGLKTHGDRCTVLARAAHRWEVEGKAKAAGI